MSRLSSKSVGAFLSRYPMRVVTPITALLIAACFAAQLFPREIHSFAPIRIVRDKVALTTGVVSLIGTLSCILAAIGAAESQAIFPPTRFAMHFLVNLVGVIVSVATAPGAE